MAWFVVEFDPATKRYGVSLDFPSKDEAMLDVYRRFAGQPKRVRVAFIEANTPAEALSLAPPIPED